MTKTRTPTLEHRYSPDGKYIASGHVSGVVSVISTDSGEIVRKFQNHRMAVRCLTFSHDSKCLIAGSDDKYLHIYDLEKNKLICECTCGVRATRIQTNTRTPTLEHRYGSQR